MSPEDRPLVVAEPLPLTNQCHQCKEWFHAMHVCEHSNASVQLPMTGRTPSPKHYDAAARQQELAARTPGEWAVHLAKASMPVREHETDCFVRLSPVEAEALALLLADIEPSE